MIRTVVCEKEGCSGNTFFTETQGNNLVLTCVHCKSKYEFDISYYDFIILSNCSKCNNDTFKVFRDTEKEGIYADACVDVLKEVIPTVDNLERALAVDGSVEDLKKGIEMTIKGFQTSLEKLGVEEISVEEGFDPNMHQAVMHIQDENYDKNVVAEVFLKGYKKGDKVIRYSMVKVAN